MIQKKTLEWFESMENKLAPDGTFLNISPGMLMGILNAGSITLGLLAVNHRMDPERMKIITLPSGDDSVSILVR